jgi:hypothetical protein
MTDWWAVLFATHATGWSILIRLLVGLVVFFPEGIQKPDDKRVRSGLVLERAYASMRTLSALVSAAALKVS